MPSGPTWSSTHGRTLRTKRSAPSGTEWMQRPPCRWATRGGVTCPMLTSRAKGTASYKGSAGHALHERHGAGTCARPSAHPTNPTGGTTQPAPSGWVSSSAGVPHLPSTEHGPSTTEWRRRWEIDSQGWRQLRVCTSGLRQPSLTVEPNVQNNQTINKNIPRKNKASQNDTNNQTNKQSNNQASKKQSINNTNNQRANKQTQKQSSVNQTSKPSNKNKQPRKQSHNQAVKQSRKQTKQCNT